MTLSPADVEQKTFSTALRGYDLDEVDDFLDEIVATIRDLSDQLATAKQAPAPAAPVSAAVGEGLDESAVGRALIAAQETADQIVADARREAERIIKEADTEADLLVSERDKRKEDAEAEMSLLTEHVAGVRAQLAVLATAVADRLDEMDEAIGLPDSMAADESSADASPGEEDHSSRGRSESGRHAGAGDHVDEMEDDEVPDNVEELILDDRDEGEIGEEGSPDEGFADGSERGW